MIYFRNTMSKRRDICKLLEKEFYANEVEMEEKSQSVLEVMDLDGGLIGIGDTMDDYWEDEYHFIRMLNHYVWKWAKQIRLNKAIST